MEKVISGRNFHWDSRWSVGKSLFAIVDVGSDMFESAARENKLRYYEVIFVYREGRYRLMYVVIRNRDYDKFVRVARKIYQASKDFELRDYRAMWKRFNIGTVTQPERYWYPEYIDDVK